MRGIDALAEMAEHLVIVSINVFDEGVQQYDPWTGAYIQCLGELNQMLTGTGRRSCGSYLFHSGCL